MLRRGGIQMNIIEMNNISKTFGDKTVLNAIHLTIKRGEIFGLLGPSGAGKTTIMKILTGQLTYRGNASVMNMDCGYMKDDIYKHIGISMNEQGFYERLSIYDNLLLFARLTGTPKEVIDDTLRKVGLLENKKIAVAKLSKGMKQRLSLAKAILHSPDILFLDEPTSGLDPLTMNAIHELMISMNNKGTTIFLTTHNMEEASKLCGHVALLNEGTICEYGIPNEICQRYNHLQKIKVKLKNGKEHLYSNGKENANEIYQALCKEEILSIHSCEPTLATVFIELTGRRVDI